MEDFFLSLSLGKQKGGKRAVFYLLVYHPFVGARGVGGAREELILLPVSAHLLTAPKPILTDTIFIKIIFSFILPAG